MEKRGDITVKHGRKEKKKRIWLRVIIGIIIALLVLVLAYAAYVLLSYYRIEDNQTLEVDHRATADQVKVDKEYTAMTYNVGFGAYTQDFTFFMDGGKQSWANSADSVKTCINGAASVLESYKTDFIFLQEVDDDSTRSYHIDEVQMLCDSFDTHSSVFACNFHSAFLAVPPTQPHGFGNSGIVTLSNVDITDSLRRSLPIADSLMKIVDLDRCYSISHVDTDNGKQLALFDVHLSAYGTNGDLQDQQLNMLFGDMQAELDKGNYVICGGDYNHDLPGGSKDAFNDEYEDYAWAADFPDEMIPEGFHKVTDYASGLTVPSCRNCDLPYCDEVFKVIVDGFIVSDNVDADFVDVVDTQFMYSDHNPVVMKFKLK